MVADAVGSLVSLSAQSALPARENVRPQVDWPRGFFFQHMGHLHPSSHCPVGPVWAGLVQKSGLNTSFRFACACTSDVCEGNGDVIAKLAPCCDCSGANCVK